MFKKLYFSKHQNKVILASILLILRIWEVLKTSVASMTSADMITSLASMTSTASLASENKKNSMHFTSWVISLALGTSTASMTSTASTTSVASLNSPASNHEKNCWDWYFHQPWHQNVLFWPFNVAWIVKKSLFYWFYGTLSFGGCGGQGCYF